MQARENLQLVLARMEVDTSNVSNILTYRSLQKIVPLELSRYYLILESSIFLLEVSGEASRALSIKLESFGNFWRSF